mgnify:CR=1 FL=1
MYLITITFSLSLSLYTYIVIAGGCFFLAFLLCVFSLLFLFIVYVRAGDFFMGMDL